MSDSPPPIPPASGPSSPSPQPPVMRPYPPPPRAPINELAFEPMKAEPGFGSILEALLKQPGSILHEMAGARRAAIILRLVVIVLVCTAVYGVVMGSLSGGDQLWAAPLKLTLGTAFSLLICLPSLYIFLCLSGVDVRIGQAVGALLAMVTLVSLLLIGFAPVAWIFSQSTNSVGLMGALHLLFWIIGLWFGVRLVMGLLRFSDRPDRGHVKVWVMIFVLVCLQMTTVLRPLIGASDRLLPEEKKFFVTHWLDTLDGR